MGVAAAAAADAAVDDDAEEEEDAGTEAAVAADDDGEESMDEEDGADGGEEEGLLPVAEPREKDRLALLAAEEVESAPGVLLLEEDADDEALVAELPAPAEELGCCSVVASALIL